MSKKNRYSDAELEEFRAIILEKIKTAEAELKVNQEQLKNKNSVKFNYIEDSALMAEREYISNQANRQEKFINHLKNAIRRIENKTYGVCRETGNLISAERLKVVPHATLSIEAKKSQRR